VNFSIVLIANYLQQNSMVQGSIFKSYLCLPLSSVMRWLIKIVISLNITVCSQYHHLLWFPVHYYNRMLASDHYKSSIILVSGELIFFLCRAYTRTPLYTLKKNSTPPSVEFLGLFESKLFWELTKWVKCGH
jgi:hypothetical protein